MRLSLHDAIDMSSGSTSSDQPGRPPLVVALTGGVASGKTAVSDRFARLGVPIIDTDEISREVVEPGTPGLKQLIATFGPRILDGQGRLNRRLMRQNVFANADHRRQLEHILHPLIARQTRRRIESARGTAYVVVVVPLLVESEGFIDADHIVVVDVPESIQLERLMARDGADPDTAQAMIDAQASRQQRLAAADEVIDNSAGLDQLDSAVDKLHRQLLARAESR